MGDRGTVYITSTNVADNDFEGGLRGIYVYAHWHGTELPDLVRAGLELGRDRWGDSQYLTRILIDQIARDGRDKETGFGVGLSLAESEHPIVVVDLHREEVSVANPGSERGSNGWRKTTSFADYVKR